MGNSSSYKDNKKNDKIYLKIAISYFAILALFIGLYLYFKPSIGEPANELLEVFLSYMEFFIEHWYLVLLLFFLGLPFIIWHHFYEKKLNKLEYVSEEQKQTKKQLLGFGIILMFLPFILIIIKNIILIIILILIILALLMLI